MPIINYYTFGDKHHHSIFICDAERCKLELQIDSVTVIGIVAKDIDDARGFAKKLFGRQFEQELYQIPRLMDGTKLYVLAKCRNCGRVMLGNGKYCSVQCEGEVNKHGKQ